MGYEYEHPGSPEQTITKSLNAIEAADPDCEHYLLELFLGLAERGQYLDDLMEESKLRRMVVQAYRKRMEGLLGAPSNCEAIPRFGLYYELQMKLLESGSYRRLETLEVIQEYQPDIAVSEMSRQLLEAMKKQQQSPIEPAGFWRKYRANAATSDAAEAKRVLTQDKPAALDIERGIGYALKARQRLENVLGNGAPALQHLRTHAPVTYEESADRIKISAFGDLAMRMLSMLDSKEPFHDIVRQMAACLLFSRAEKVEDLISYERLFQFIQDIQYLESAKQFYCAATSESAGAREIHAISAWKQMVLSGKLDFTLDTLLPAILKHIRICRQPRIHKHTNKGEVLFDCFLGGHNPPRGLF